MYAIRMDAIWLCYWGHH